MIAQKIAAVIVGLLLLLFLSAVGVALVAYGPLVDAAALADARWGEVWKASGQRATAADRLAGLAAGAGHRAAETAAAAEAAARVAAFPGRPEIAPLAPKEMLAFAAAQRALDRAVAGLLSGDPGADVDGEWEAQRLAFARATGRFAESAEAFDAAAEGYNAAIAAFPASLITRPLRFLPRPLIRHEPAPDDGG